MRMGDADDRTVMRQLLHGGRDVESKDREDWRQTTSERLEMSDRTGDRRPAARMLQ